MLITCLKCVGHLPLPLRSAVGWCMGYIFGLIPSRERDMSELQIKAFLGSYSAPKIATRVFASVGQSAVESLNLTPMAKPGSKHVSCPDWALVKELTARQAGIVALTAHTGNWDLLAAYFISHGLSISTIGRPARNPLLHQGLVYLREKYGVRTIWRNDPNAVRNIILELKKNGIIAGLIDQDTDVSSTFVPFFGAPAKTPSGLVALAKRYGASIVTCFCVRTGFLKYTIILAEIDSGLSVEEVLAEYNRRLEQVIRDYPDQWVWFHKRWRTKPAEGKLPGEEYRRELEDRLSRTYN